MLIFYIKTLAWNFEIISFSFLFKFFGYYETVHPPPSTSTQLISTSTQLHPPPSSSFQPPPSYLEDPQHYYNHNIAHNWAIFSNLGRKIQSCPFWLKIDTRILEVLIPFPNLDFWNFDPKIHFWVNLGQKSQSCPFCLKIGIMVSWGCWSLFWP